MRSATLRVAQVFGLSPRVVLDTILRVSRPSTFCPIPERLAVTSPRIVRKLSVSALVIPALWALASSLHAQLAFQQVNLVSDLPGHAVNTDPRLVNPWGISFSATSPFWVSNAGSGTSTLYNSSGTPQSLVVTLPRAGVPTGQVFNSSASSGAFNGDVFLFASENGMIAGWRGALGTSAEILIDNSGAGASYLGLALGSVASNTYLYAANFANGRIDVFPSTGAPALPGLFTDPGLPSGYAPFNIQNIGNTLFVEYAVRGAGGDEVTGAGLGIVNKFDLNGNFVSRFVSNGVLDAPWGVARAPAGFGPFGGNLLVGNFGDGKINAFDFITGAPTGTLADPLGHPIVNEGLWGITFGNGGQGGRPDTLYIAVGIEDEAHGLFASISTVPESGPTAGLAGFALATLLVAKHSRRRRREA